MYYLRELERKDLETINRWRNDPDLVELLGAPFRYINLDVDIKWYESYMGNRGNALRCVITKDDSDQILGVVSLVSVNYMNQSAELHIMIGDKENRGKGVGAYAVKEMLNHAFYNMNLQRVELTVLEDNEPAKHFYEKIGFVCEGRKRKAKFKNGQFVDMLMYSVLRSEFTVCVGGGVIKLPTYHVDIAESKGEIDCAIRKCDTAFTLPVNKRNNYDELLNKLNTNATVLVAFDKDILGYIAFYCNDLKSTTAYISLIAVIPDQQNRHIGRCLLNCCEEHCRKKGMQNIKLEVRLQNKNAIRFYLKSGFEFREINRTDSIYMKKILEY